MFGHPRYTVFHTIRNGEHVWIVFQDGCSWGNYEYATQQEAWEKLHELVAQTTGRS